MCAEGGSAATGAAALELDMSCTGKLEDPGTTGEGTCVEDLDGSFGGAYVCCVLETACEMLPGGTETYETDDAGAPGVAEAFGEARVVVLDCDA